MAARLNLREEPPHPNSCSEVAVLAGRFPACERRRFLRGATVYRIGDTFRMLYVVRLGTLMAITLSDDGLTQVSGFAMAGETLGLDGLCDDVHHSEVVALDDCELYAIPSAWYQQWTRQSRDGEWLIMRALAREIVRSQDLMLMLGTMRADRRVAIFLLDLSERFGRLGYSRSEFVLQMSRKELGSYLGLKLETVSRTLSRFQQEGLIQARGKSIALLDHPALWQLSGHRCELRSPHLPIVDRDGNLRLGGRQGSAADVASPRFGINGSA